MVSIHDSARAYAGTTLFCHAYEEPEKTSASGKGHIYLIDMEGTVVHEWTTTTAQQSHCRLLPDGNLIYPTRDRSKIEEAGLRELDPESNVVWDYHCRIDHDYQLLQNGNLMLHTITDCMVPELGVGLKRSPYILEITKDKRLLWEWRGEDHIDELEQLLPPGGWDFFQERINGRFAFDWAHNNTCQMIPPNATAEKEEAQGKPLRFRPGNIVFSYRSVDIIGVIDRESGRIVWGWGPGELDGQHKPHMLANGNILIYDNGTLRGYSRVIELNPLTGEIEWEFTAEPRESFFSAFISGAQRLPNGNTLICEGGKCRFLEVAPDKEVVWEYTSPFTEDGAMATYRCLRYPVEYVAPLLERIQHV